MASFNGFVVVLATLVLLVSPAFSVSRTYFVGDDAGWTRGMNYHLWANHKNFTIGDFLAFRYPAHVHTVAEVTREGFGSCDGRNPISFDDSGYTMIQLRSSGWHYFISTKPHDCGNDGMFLSVPIF